MANLPRPYDPLDETIDGSNHSGPNSPPGPVLIQDGQFERQANGEVSDVRDAVLELRHFFQMEIGSLRQDMSAKMTSRPSDPFPTFKFEGHRHQYCLNAKVLQSIQDAQEALSASRPAAAVASLHEAVETITERQKLIKIADASPGGWDTVKELVGSTDLTSDPKEAKAIKAAEARAMANKKSRPVAGRPRPQPYQFDRPPQRFRFEPVDPAYGYPQQSAPAYRPVQPLMAAGGQGGFRPTYRPPISQDRRLQACYSCGNTGHWRSQCPLKAATQPSGNQFGPQFSGYE